MKKLFLLKHNYSVVRLRTFAVCFLVFLSSLLSSAKGFSQNSNTKLELTSFDVATWIEIAPLSPRSSEMLCAASGIGGEWSVSSKNSEVQVRPLQEKQTDLLPFDLPKKSSFLGRRTAVAINDGYLVGFDAGEWGGGLWWFSENGSKNYRISKEHVKNIFDVHGAVLVISGIAHGIKNTGKITQLVNHSNIWTIEKTIDLGSAPMTALHDDKGTVFIITTKGLLRYYSDKVEILHLTNYALLYPNSLAIGTDGTVFVGMRFAVAKLVPRQGEYLETWLVQPKCASFERIDGKCGCTPAVGFQK